MNLNGDEKRIRQLFLEMRLEDEQRAPAFAGVLQAAISGTTRSQDRVRPMRLAFALVTLIVLVLGTIAILKHRDGFAPSNVQEQATVEREAPSPIPDSTGAPVPKPRVVAPRAVKHHRRPAPKEPALDLKSLFAWQSPTASLLKGPKDDLLMSLPRLGESLDSIKAFSPDLWN